MRCPSCQTENPAQALDCRACGHRLYAWLGDPFGARERPVRVIVARRGASPASGHVWLKAVVALVCFVLVAPRTNSVALIALGSVAVVLWRWPRLGCLPFAVVLAVALLAAKLL